MRASQEESGQYLGNFVRGMRHGNGIMVWSDRTTFSGVWNLDKREYGTLLLANEWTYIGRFVNDMLDGP